MLPFTRLTRLPVGLPPAGARVLFAGDSIFDHTFRSLGAVAQRQGKMADALRQSFGWTLLNANKVKVDPSAEAVLSTSLVTGSTTLTRDNAGGAGGSTWSNKVTSTGVANATVYLEGDTGTLSMGMRGGETYTFSADYWVPVGTTGTISPAIFDRVGAGAYANTNVAITAANAWQHIALTRTIQAGATEAFVRPVQWNGSPAAGQAIWFDNPALSCNGADPGALYEPSNTYRSGVSNRLLQLTDNDGVGNGLNLLGASVLTAAIAAYMPLDMVVIFLGTNDYGYSVTTGASTASTKSRTTWRAALVSMMQQLNTLFPPVRIVLCSLMNQAVGAASTTAAPNWGIPGASKGGIYLDMNRITAEVAATYDAVYVDLSGITGSGNLDDGTHPLLAGSDAMATAFKKAFGQ